MRMPCRSPLRTSAYVCDAEMFSTSATSARVRNRSGGNPPCAVAVTVHSLANGGRVTRLSTAGTHVRVPSGKMGQMARVVPSPAPSTGPSAGPSPASPVPRRTRAPRWLDLRLAGGIALVLLAVVVGARLFSTAQRTEPVLAVTRDLAAGTVLRAGDLTVVQVRVPGSTYLDDRGAAVGKALTRPVSAGELLPAGAVAQAPATTTLSVPLAAGSAPSLRAGQRIGLWLSTPACASVVLLAEVPVQQVAPAAGLGGGQDVVIGVRPDQVERVIGALAIDKAVVRAGVLTGSAANAAALPPLTDCLRQGR
ncbi:MAG: hypothetical protein EPN43_07270 [Jatrophihabitans sp.]|nr:MAG: hypothetical protein EPN43_07270 [Jatrophihabitans sp.]